MGPARGECEPGEVVAVRSVSTGHVMDGRIEKPACCDAAGALMPARCCQSDLCPTYALSLLHRVRKERERERRREGERKKKMVEGI